MSGVVIELSGLVGSGVVVLVRSWDGSLGVVVGVLGIVSRVTGFVKFVCSGVRKGVDGGLSGGIMVLWVCAGVS